VGWWLRLTGWLLLLGIIAALAGLIVFQQRVARTVALADLRDNRPPAYPLVTPMNMLLLGVDLREGHLDEGVRSDTIMLLHLDPPGAWGSLLSIPRDSVADIPGFGQSKINAAFNFGYNNATLLHDDGVDPVASGAALAADTAEQFLNLPAQGQRINYVATINFDGFAKMVDAVGGIEVDVPFEIVDTEYPTEDFGIMTIRIPAGRQRMDGTTALQYVRTRHADSDFGRAERQQQVVQAIVAALRDRPALLRPFAALRLMEAAGEATRTTLPVGRLDALLMAAMLTRVEPESIAQHRISPETVPVQEFGSDLVWDQAGIQELLRQWLTAPGEEQEAATIQVLNGAGVGGVAGRLTENLRAQGFTVTTPGNADLTTASQIIDYGDHPATRRRLSRALGGLDVIEGSSVDAPPGVGIVVILGEDYGNYWRER
jgi:polyisoprenyl-teichoic acid--peptidoglycan teichoic acid transferase